jgi:hypothetical protein
MDCYTFISRLLIRFFMKIWERWRSAQSLFYTVSQLMGHSHDRWRRQTNTHLLNCITNGHASWTFEYNYETKRQSMEWRTRFVPEGKAVKCILSVYALRDCYRSGFRELGRNFERNPVRSFCSFLHYSWVLPGESRYGHSRSPDRMPDNFFLFPKCKPPLKDSLRTPGISRRITA